MCGSEWAAATPTSPSGVPERKTIRSLEKPAGLRELGFLHKNQAESMFESSDGPSLIILSAFGHFPTSSSPSETAQRSKKERPTLAEARL